jgi:hypothetical protein
MKEKKTISLRISNEMVFCYLKNQTVSYEKEHNCNSISKEQIRHFSTQHTSNINSRKRPINNCPIVLNLNFPWTHVLNQPLELMVQHEQFQFQLIESKRGYKKNNVTVPKAPAPREGYGCSEQYSNTDS